MITEDMIRVTECTVLGELPNPFIMDDGTPLTEPKQWAARRQEIYKTAVELQYGTQPPKPEFLTVERLNESWGSKIFRYGLYRITTGTKAHPISFTMHTFSPLAEGNYPVVIDGDFCFGYVFNEPWIRTFTDHGVTLVMFARTELANDVLNEGRGKGPLYAVYPDKTFGALGAWAWGYSRCVDALEQLGMAKGTTVAFTGHSRGGKTALLAGALDERAAIVNPNATCAGAAGCYRIHMKAIAEDGEERPSETLKYLLGSFDFWMGPQMKNYADCEEKLPFDSHYLKAMVAPRVLLVTEAASDIHANPVGSWMTSVAAGEVYHFLGKPENLYWHFRPGYHYHKIEDIQALVNVIHHVDNGEPLADDFFKTPFKQPERCFSWKSPR